MQIGIVGSGRMGGNIARRLARGVVEVIVMMRFASQGKSDYADKLVSMMRKGFGGHAVGATGAKK